MIIKSYRPKNETEAQCFDKLVASGWNFTKKGYADFFCYKDGDCCFIEVKRKATEPLKAEQIFFMDAMTNKGIKCYKYTTDKGLQKWEDIRDIEKSKREVRQKKRLLLSKSKSKRKYNEFNFK